MKRGEGTPSPKMLIFLVIRSLTLNNDQWVTFSSGREGWRKLLWLHLIWCFLQANRLANGEMRGYIGPQNADFPCFFFHSVTLNYDLLIKFSDRTREPPELQLIWDQLRAHWLANQEMRGYTELQNEYFLVFRSVTWHINPKCPNQHFGLISLFTGRLIAKGLK